MQPRVSHAVADVRKHYIDKPPEWEHIESGSGAKAVFQTSFSEWGRRNPLQGEILIRRKCIEPVHNKGGFRLPRLTRREF
jgi:hypothetical protein